MNQLLSLAPENSYDKNEVSDGVEFDLGFAVTYSNLPPDWSILFTNAIEGLLHKREPYFTRER